MRKWGCAHRRASTGYGTNDEGDRELAAGHVPYLGGVVNDLVHGEEAEVDGHQLYDRAKAGHGGADAGADDNGLRKRGVLEANDLNYVAFDGLTLSNVGMGTYLGEPDRSTDMAVTEAIKASVQSGINVVDTAINYRSQKAERAVGAAVGELGRGGRRLQGSAVHQHQGRLRHRRRRPLSGLLGLCS